MLGYTFDTDTLDKITESMKGLQDSTTALEKVLAKHDFPETMAEARHFCDVVIPAMAAVRGHADFLEGYLADDLWPLPTYQEMVFIK